MLKPTVDAQRRRASAFTLVELLVVIGIIALLISILLPSLNRARQAAQSVVCQSNLRQIGVALRLYAGANRDYLPPAYFVNNPNMGQSTLWHLSLRAMLSKRGDGTFSTQGITTLDFRCPSAIIDTPIGQNANHYSANPRFMPMYEVSGFGFGVDRLSGRTGSWPTFKLTKVSPASEKILVTDGAQRAANDAFRPGEAEHSFYNVGTDWAGNLIWIPWAQLVMSDSWMAGSLVRWRSLDGVNRNVDGPTGNGYIRFRHVKNTYANAVFADGHVEAFKTRPDGRTDMKLEYLSVTFK